MTGRLFSINCSVPGSRCTDVRLALICLIALLALDLMIYCSEGKTDDRDDLMEAVTSYFEAEKSGDTGRIWEMLAPSSMFKTAYSYPFYVEMVRRNRIVVKDYEIEEVLEVVDNPDPPNMLKVEKIATVRVMVTLSGAGGKDSRHVSTFTFLREAGRWYKG